MSVTRLALDWLVSPAVYKLSTSTAGQAGSIQRPQTCTMSTRLGASSTPSAHQGSELSVGPGDNCPVRRRVGMLRLVLRGPADKRPRRTESQAEVFQSSGRLQFTFDCELGSQQALNHRAHRCALNKGMILRWVGSNRRASEKVTFEWYDLVQINFQ